MTTFYRNVKAIVDHSINGDFQALLNLFESEEPITLVDDIHYIIKNLLMLYSEEELEQVKRYLLDDAEKFEIQQLEFQFNGND